MNAPSPRTLDSDSTRTHRRRSTPRYAAWAVGRGTMVAAVVLGSLVSGLTFTPIATAAPSADTFESVPAPDPMEPGKVTYKQVPQAPFVPRGVHTPAPVTDQVVADDGTATPVDGLPVELQAAPVPDDTTVADPTSSSTTTAPTPTTPPTTAAPTTTAPATTVPSTSTTEATSTTTGGDTVDPVGLTVQSLGAIDVKELGGEVLAFGVTPAPGELSDGPVALDVDVDISTFQYALGADWAQRLQLVEWDCSVTQAINTPDACGQPHVLEGVTLNDATGVLSGTVVLGDNIGGATFGASRAYASGSTLGLTSGAGSFAATTLSNSGTWQVGGNNGGFSYSVPIATPPAFNGLGPSVSLGYDSSGVDGITSAVNSQASEVGLGWNLNAGQGFIERRTLGCSDPRIGGGTSDGCWYVQNATISLNGHSSELVPIDGTTGDAKTFNTWRLKDDPDWIVQRINGGNSATWWVGETWKVTTPDGMVYSFGSNLAGQNSVLKRPLRGLTATDPCYAEPSHLCRDTNAMPYRWMLDKVEDPYGNVMVYDYELQKNRARVLGQGETTATVYDMGALLADIKYGMSPNIPNTPQNPAAATEPISTFRAKVEFTYVRRCGQALTTANDTDCPTINNTNGSWYPDVPTDLYCPTGAGNCVKDVSFFQIKRLSLITTSTSSDGSAWTPVAQWRLTHGLLNPGDGGNEKLWLGAINRVTYTSPTASQPLSPTLLEPAVVFTPILLANRAGTYTMYQPRISSISDALGQKIAVAYMPAMTCPTTWANNTTTCFPMYASFPGVQSGWGTYRRWPVATVTVSDMVTGPAAAAASGIAGPYDTVTPDITYSYAYTGPGWHHDSADWWVHTPGANDVSWGQWRGFRQVTTTVGTGTIRTVTKDIYFQGLHGDDNGSGGTKSVPMAKGWTTPADGAGTVTDDDTFQGQVFESYQMDDQATAGSPGAYLSATRNYPATNAVTGWSVTGVQVDTRVPIPSTRKTRTMFTHTQTRYGTAATPAWRFGKTSNTYDSIGRLTQTYTERARDVNNAAQETGVDTCDWTWYLNGATTYLWSSLVAQQASYNGPCATSQPIKVSKTFYNNYIAIDGANVKDARAQDVGAGFKPFATTAMSRIRNWDGIAGTDSKDRWTWTSATFDSAGRATSTTDANGNTTTFGFNHTYGYPNLATYPTVNGVTMSTSTSLRAEDGQPLLTVDQNGLRTDYCYDSLGRVTVVFAPKMDRTARLYANLGSYGTVTLCNNYNAAVNPPAGTAPTPYAEIPNATFTYTIPDYTLTGYTRTSKPPAVVVSSILQDALPGANTSGATRIEAAAFVDGGGHIRETHTHGAGDIMIVNGVSLSDERGNNVRAYDTLSITDSTPANWTSGVTTAAQGFVAWPKLPTASTLPYTRSTYDTFNRTTQTARFYGTNPQSWTNTAYIGPTTTVTPFIGAARETTVDALGRTTRVDTFQGSTAPTGQGLNVPGARTTYSYSYNQTAYAAEAGWLTTTVIDDATNASVSTTDLQGHTIVSTDPDAGTSKFMYDSNGNVTATLDANTNLLRTGYDALNRPTGRTGTTYTGGNTWPAPVQRGGELLVNGNFEAGTTGWNTYAGTGMTSSLLADVSKVHDYTNGWTLATTGTGSLYQDVTVNVGDTATASIWVRAQAPSTSGSGSVCLYALGAATTCTPFAATDAWQQINVGFTSPAVSSTVRLEVYPAANSGTITLDDASVTLGAANDRLASWAYDSAPGGKGMAATETAWKAGVQYTTSVLGYNGHVQATGTKVNIPGVFGTDLLAGDWKFVTTYNEAGQPVTVYKPTVPFNPTLNDPAVTNPGAAGVTYDPATTHYNGLGLADTLSSTVGTTTSWYVTGTTFDNLNRVTQRRLTTNTAYTTLVRGAEYDPATGAVSKITAGWQTAGTGTINLFQDDRYARDGIGNVTSITDYGLEAGGSISDTKECFTYDTWNRLTAGSTTTRSAACSAPVGTGATTPYAYTWQYDDINRMKARTDTLNGTNSTAYTVGVAGHPHAVASNTGTSGGSYSYDAAGAMTVRKNDNLTYDRQQRLVVYAKNGGATDTYTYGVANQRLIRQTGTTRTLYLPGLEIKAEGTTRTNTNYLTIGSSGVATKVSITAGSGPAGLWWNCASLQNSTTCQASAATSNAAQPNPARARYTPYGDVRVAATYSHTDHGFLNQPKDTTSNLNYLNNRYYDPTLGAFTSVDPLVGKTGQPYLYGNGNPATLSDPSGLHPCEATPSAGKCGLFGKENGPKNIDELNEEITKAVQNPLVSGSGVDEWVVICNFSPSQCELGDTANTHPDQWAYMTAEEKAARNANARVAQLEWMLLEATGQISRDEKGYPVFVGGIDGFPSFRISADRSQWSVLVTSHDWRNDPSGRELWKPLSLIAAGAIVYLGCEGSFGLACTRSLALAKGVIEAGFALGNGKDPWTALLIGGCSTGITLVLPQLVANETKLVATVATASLPPGKICGEVFG